MMATAVVDEQTRRQSVDRAVLAVARGFCSGCNVPVTLRRMPLDPEQRNGQADKLRSDMLADCNREGKRVLSECPCVIAFNGAVSPDQRVG